MIAAPDLSLVHDVATNILGTQVSIERVPEGVSTFVYRIRRGQSTCYLRILPEESSFAVEARVHDLLREMGVVVPQVLHFEALNPLLQKSILLVDEIPGSSIARCADSDALDTILRTAGSQLALLNTLPVDGFGWIDRTIVEPLRGERPTFADFYAADLGQGLADLARLGFSDSEIASLRTRLDETLAQMEGKDAVLVHGDFDVFHIFCHNGQYSGLIDLGEMMGNHPLYDLALMHFYDELPAGGTAFDSLLAGYAEIHPLGESDIQTIQDVALLFGVWKIEREGRKATFNASFVSRLLNRTRAILATR